jgi:hypothetical protein
MKKQIFIMFIMFANCCYAFADVSLKIDDTYFPIINLSLTIEQNEESFNESNIEIKENDIFQDIGNFYSPKSFENFNAVDIVFVYDDSRSMQSEAATVYTNIYALVNALTSSGVDYRVGLVPFGGLDNSSVPNGTILNYGSLYDQKESLFDDINQMQMDGSTERAYCAISNAIQHIAWRSFAQKYIVLITDEDNDADGCSVDQNSLITRLTEKLIFFYCYMDDSAGQATTNFSPIAEATGGSVFQVTDSMLFIFNQLATHITSTYMIQYRTKDVESSDTRHVAVKLNVDQQIKTVEGTYTPNNLQLSLTDDTKAIFSKAQAVQTDIPISVNCSSEEAAVKLYVKSSESSSYFCLDMAHNGSGIYTSAIPESFVLSPYLNFYLSASRDDDTITLPETDAGSSPFVVPIGYEPPEIMHIPETQSILAYNFHVITASVSFDRDEEVQMTLFYKSSNDYSYNAISEFLPVTKRDFEKNIPSASIYGNHIAYYMIAEDENGIQGSFGSSDDPVIVDVMGYTVTQRIAGSLIVYADVIEQDTINPNKWLATGNVRVGTRTGGSELLGITSTITLNTATLQVEDDLKKGLIALNIKRNVDCAPENFPLYHGRFSIDGNHNPPIIHLIEGDSKMELIDHVLFLLSDNYQNHTMTVEDDQIIVNNIFTDISGGIPLTLSVDQIILSQNGNSSAAITANCLACQENYTINEISGRIEDPVFIVDFSNNGLTGHSTLYLEKIHDAAFPATYQFSNNPLAVDQLSGNLLGYTNILSVPRNNRVLADITRGDYLIDNISSNDDPTITGSKIKMKINNKRNIMKSVRKAPVTGDSLEMEIFTDKKIEFKGLMKLLGEFRIENSNLYLHKNTKMMTGDNVNVSSDYVEGKISISDFASKTDDYESTASGDISGDISLNIDSVRSHMELSGENYLELNVPEDARWIGGKAVNKNFNFNITYNSDGLQKANIYTVYQHIDLTLTVNLDISDLEEPVLYIQGYTNTSEYQDAIEYISGGRKRSRVLDTFTINNDYDQLVLKIISQYNYPLFNLTVPTAEGAKKYSPDTATTSPIDIEKNNLYFDYIAAANESFYVVNNPMKGDYIPELTNENDIGDYQILLLGPNATPNISIVAPSTTIEDQSQVTIEWIASDPDDNPDIALYYDQDNTGNNGVLIQDGFKEEGTNTYTWVLAEDMLSGEYYIYAKIDDHENAPVYAYSTGKIIFKNASAPSIPTIVSTQPTNGGIFLKWQENAIDENVIAYRIYLSNSPGSGIYDYNIAVSSITDYTLSGLTSGHEYEVFLSAVNDEGLESDLTDSQRVIPEGNLLGSADLIVDSDHSLITSTTGKLENDISIVARIQNISDNEAQSAQIVCYYGSIVAENRIQTLTVTSIPANLTADVIFHLNVSSVPNFYDLEIFYIVIQNVLPSELETSNNTATISNHLPFDYTIHLTEGFNLISFPNEPLVSSTAEFIKSLSPNCQVVWEGYSQSYDPDNPQMDDIKNLKAGTAYWFEMGSDDTMIVTGSFPGRSVSLKSGWNWVGYNSMSEHLIPEIFSGINDYKVLSYIDDQVQWQMYDSSFSSNDLSTMKPGHGYGIFVTEEMTLTFP